MSTPVVPSLRLPTYICTTRSICLSTVTNISTPRIIGTPRAAGAPRTISTPRATMGTPRATMGTPRETSYFQPAASAAAHQPVTPTYVAETRAPAPLNPTEVDALADRLLGALSWTNSFKRIMLTISRDVTTEIDLKQVLLKAMDKIIEVADARNFVTPTALKDKFSRLIGLLDYCFPTGDWKGYFFDFGPVAKIPEEAKAAPPAIISKFHEAKFSVTLGPKSVELVMAAGEQFFIPREYCTGLPRTVPLLELERDVAGYVNHMAPDSALNAPPFYMVVRFPPSAHIANLAAQKVNGVLEFVFMDSLGGDYYADAPISGGAARHAGEKSFVHKTAKFLRQTFAAAGKQTKVSYFSTIRQRDTHSCPIFTTRDFHLASAMNIFSYVKLLEEGFPHLIQERARSEKDVVQSIPVHPRMALMTQSATYFAELDPEFVDAFLGRKELDTELKTSLLPDANGRIINFRSQRDLLRIISTITRRVLTPLPARTPSAPRMEESSHYGAWV